jgi:hypothetical protein
MLGKRNAELHADMWQVSKGAILPSPPITARSERQRRRSALARVLAMLRQREVTVPVYNYADHGYAKLLHSVPGTWYVYDADPWAPQQVMLFVGPVWPQPVSSTPGPGTPVPSPTAIGS